MVDKLTNKLIELEIIDASDRDLYTYGITQGIRLLYNLITVMLVGVILNMAWQAVLYIVILGSVLGCYEPN